MLILSHIGKQIAVTLNNGFI